MNDDAGAARDRASRPAWRSMLRAAGGLLGAAHLGPSLAVTLAACVLALGAGLGGRTWLVGLAVGSGQLSIGWSNDALDWRRDRAVGRRDKPVASGLVGPRTVAAAATVALLVCVAASAALSVAAAVVHLLAVTAGWAYNVRAKHAWYSVVPWAVAFGLLPAVVTLTAPLSRWPAWWLLAAGSLLGAGAHFANALPDLDADRSTGVRGLPHRLGHRGTLAAAVVLVALGHALVGIGSARSGGGVTGMATAAGAGVTLAAIVLAATRGHERASFHALVVLLLLLAVSVVVGGARIS